jgi:hypothetical protein
MITLITYGDKNFKNSKLRLLKNAKLFGIENTYAFGPNDIDKNFKLRTSPFIFQKRGAGYWIWKPYFLKKIFDTIQDGEIIIYLDAGCDINLNGKPAFYEYVNFMDQNKGVFSFHIPNCFEFEYTNESTFNFFNVKQGDKIFNSEQLVGGIFMLRKNNFTSYLVDQYFSIALNNPILFTDDYDWGIDKNYKEHRHDQSIFSILRKKEDLNSMIDETWAKDWNTLADKPFHAKRIKDLSYFDQSKIFIKYFINKFLN